MKFFGFTSIILLTLSANAFEFSPEEVAAWQKSFQGLQKLALDQGTISDAEYLEKLGQGLRVTTRNLPDSFGDRVGTHRIIRDRMIQIPGHAEHFEKIIWESYGKFKGGYDEGKGAFYRGPYLKRSHEAFSTLALLPSPETVRVLGSMLNEDWKWPNYEAMELSAGQQSTLDVRAVGTLALLPFAEPPSKPLQHTTSLRENVGVWRQWYDEIESGHRTFRFIGDDTEYTLRGPSKRGAIDPGRRESGRRSRPPSTNASAAADRPTTATWYLPYLLGGIFLLAGLYLFLRGKRRRA